MQISWNIEKSKNHCGSLAILSIVTFYLLVCPVKWFHKIQFYLLHKFLPQFLSYKEIKAIKWCHKKEPPVTLKVTLGHHGIIHRHISGSIFWVTKVTLRYVKLSTIYLFGIISSRLTRVWNENHLYMSGNGVFLSWWNLLLAYLICFQWDNNLYIVGIHILWRILEIKFNEECI